MTDNKRFEIYSEGSSLIDVPLYYINNDDFAFEVYGSKNNAEKVCDLLNENEHLKSELVESKKAHSNCDKLWWKLHDENKELKAKLKELQE